MVKIMSIILVLGTVGVTFLLLDIRRLEAAKEERRAMASVSPTGKETPASEKNKKIQPKKVISPRLIKDPVYKFSPVKVNEELTGHVVECAKKIPVPMKIHGVFGYVIESGDWIEELSRRFGVPLELIREIQGLDPDTIISVGEVFYIPIIEYSERVGLASWYGNEFDGRMAANGAIFNQDQISVAALHYPFDLRLEIERMDNKKKISAQVLDRGPYVEGRIIDLSRGAARELRAEAKGVVEVWVRPKNDHLARIDRYLGKNQIALARN